MIQNTITKEFLFSCKNQHPEIFYESYYCPICENELLVRNAIKEIKLEIKMLKPGVQVMFSTWDLEEKFAQLETILAKQTI